VTDNTVGRPKLTTGPTLSDQAYKALREDITTGALKPGQRLTERGLAEHLGVSPTPVREALQRLEHERLIERDTVRAIRVADPSVARLRELSLIDVALRGVAARLAAERATAAEVAAIVAACDRAEALADGGELDPELPQAAAAASSDAATAVLTARLGQLRADISFSYERLQICYSKGGSEHRVVSRG